MGWGGGGNGHRWQIEEEVGCLAGATLATFRPQPCPLAWHSPKSVTLTVQLVPSVLHSVLLLPCQQSFSVHPLEEHVLWMHFWPVATLGQSVSAQHSEQMLGVAGQRLPARTARSIGL